ncbi:MFS transporter [Paenibacillus sp. ACRRX]|uniref:MFS transporter n=1 Tax=Paenibacillus sp. ACRRX TaxID=2918206 RepID=UPI001EF66AC2|nr:MFS transporter [Paenibacillus sp. ACRRX]MCG7407182.1 MFS transporter [Paenibacillus sp. ACRRX]
MKPSFNLSTYSQLFRNRTLMMLWSGGIISLVGDIFFNIAIVWAVYSHSQSMLQSSLVQVVWHVNRLLMGFVAGTVADRYNRKLIMVTTNILASSIIGLLAVVVWKWDNPPVIVTLCFVFLLNGITTFMTPAQSSVIPDVVGPQLLADATGTYSILSRVFYIVGSSVAGIFISFYGVLSAIIVNACSFLAAALFILPLQLPANTKSDKDPVKKSSFLREMRNGWQEVTKIPVLKTIIMLGMLINVASFMGPLLPGLVDQQLHAGAAALGSIEAAAVVGAILAGLFAGSLERKIGAGRVMIIGLCIVGLSVLGIAMSSWLPLTLLLFTIRMLGMTMTNIAMGTAIQLVISQEYRGRAWGISSSLAVIAIPISSLIGGYAADFFGAAPLYIVGGIWFLCCASFIGVKKEIRTLRLHTIYESHTKKDLVAQTGITSSQ